ncbi:hypothetical protein AS4_13140 [Acinetobacter guillouiae]|nr:hypothetical protein AS4_13140 [Acinetobacter guillouiae]
MITDTVYVLKWLQLKLELDRIDHLKYNCFIDSFEVYNLP